MHESKYRLPFFFHSNCQVHTASEKTHNYQLFTKVVSHQGLLVIQLASLTPCQPVVTSCFICIHMLPSQDYYHTVIGS